LCRAVIFSDKFLNVRCKSKEQFGGKEWAKRKETKRGKAVGKSENETERHLNEGKRTENHFISTMDTQYQNIRRTG